MTILSLGDLAVSYQQKLHSSRIRGDLLRLTDELASGQRHDLRAATRGNFTVLAALEHQLGTLRAYRTAASEASLFAGAVQNALGSVQDATSDFAPDLLQAAESGTAPWLQAAAHEARSRFVTVVATLNVSVADRTLLGGTATAGPALAGAEDMLAQILAAASGETTAAGVEAAVEAWFDDAGGGFETAGYLGGDALEDLRIGPGQTLRLPAKADDGEIRDLLKSYAMAALSDAGALPNDAAERAALMRRAGERMFTANAALATYRGGIGAAEAAIDTALARNASETGALEVARNDIVAADPYATAVDLEATQLQLQSLYTVTARLSRLSLTEFLR